jgi:hypothetical protein
MNVNIGSALIDGQQVAKAWVSADVIAQRLGVEVADVLGEVGSKVPRKEGAGTWLQLTSDRSLTALVDRTGILDHELLTAAVASESYPALSTAMIDDVIDRHGAVMTPHGIRAASFQAFEGAYQLSGSTRRILRTAGRGERGSAPIDKIIAGSVAGVAVAAGGAITARGIGDPLEPSDNQRTRRTGFLLGTGAVATGGGLATWRAWRGMSPLAGAAAMGVASGGALLGVLGASALGQVEGGS